MDTSLIFRKVSFLASVFDLEKDKIDAGPHPMNPDFRVALGNYAVAELVRDISLKLSDGEVAAKLHTAAKELVAKSSHQLVADWDDGTDICPPWRWPHPKLVGDPHPDPWRVIAPNIWVSDPSPDPWLEAVSPAMQEILLAHALRSLASLTTDEAASTSIRLAGESIIKSASRRLFDDYCATPGKPRIPVPRTKVVAA